MAINNINNGESALWIRNILNQVIDKVNDLDKMMSREIVELTGGQDGINLEFTTAKSYTLGSSELYVNGRPDCSLDLIISSLMRKILSSNQ